MTQIRALRDDDRDGWEPLYVGYRTFYGYDPGVLDRTWSWLTDGTILGLVATEDDRLIGLAHYRSYPRPISGVLGCYLDDLFVDPAARTGGVGAALIDAVAEQARCNGWAGLQWKTKESNAVARRVYDKVATKTDFLTYDMPL